MKKHVLLFLGVFLLCLALSTPASAIDIGSPPPDFKLTTPDGKVVQLSDFKGRIILLKLSTTWCPTCKQQTKEIEDAAGFLKKNNVVVIEVFLQDTEEMVAEFLQGKDFQGVDFFPLLDDQQVYKAYNVYLIPRVLIIDQDFTVRRDGSLMTSSDLTKAIESLTAPKS